MSTVNTDGVQSADFLSSIIKLFVTLWLALGQHQKVMVKQEWKSNCLCSKRMWHEACWKCTLTWAPFRSLHECAPSTAIVWRSCYVTHTTQLPFCSNLIIMHPNIVRVEYVIYIIRTKKIKRAFPQYLITKNFDNYFHIRILLNLNTRFMG